MDLTFIANDTRGGVEPYLALAAEAAARGHIVRAVAPQEHEAAFTSLGARFAGLDGTERSQVAAAAQKSISLREMGRRASELAAGWATTSLALAQGTELVVAGIGGMAVARPVAQKLGTPLLRAHLQPLDARSSAYAGPLASSLDAFGPAARLASHAITAAGTSLISLAPERSARRALDLAPSPSPSPNFATILYGFSPAVVPVSSDATTRRMAAGYWNTVGAEGLAPALQEFIEGPEPIVSIGFGSMVAGDPQHLLRIVTDAIRLVGVRAVLLTGWGALAASDMKDTDIFVTPSAPHSQLFPRMAATVHHGGAGTTGAALSAGKPTVIVPFGADQPFWARRAHGLGVAPLPVPRARLTSQTLADALQLALTDDGMTRRSHRLGEILRQENGVSAALDEIESIAEVAR